MRQAKAKATPGTGGRWHVALTGLSPDAIHVFVTRRDLEAAPALAPNAPAAPTSAAATLFTVTNGAAPAAATTAGMLLLPPAGTTKIKHCHGIAVIVAFGHWHWPRLGAANCACPPVDRVVGLCQHTIHILLAHESNKGIPSGLSTLVAQGSIKFLKFTKKGKVVTDYLSCCVFEATHEKLPFTIVTYVEMVARNLMQVVEEGHF